MSPICHRATEMTLPYIPEHLHYVFFELLKNSCRAVTERFQDDPSKMEPIQVVFAEGAEDVAIKISDKVRDSRRWQGF